MRIRIPNTVKKSIFKIKWFRDPDLFIICVVDQDPVPGPDPVISLLNKFEKSPESCGVR
jgi:hypothetical protein